MGTLRGAGFWLATIIILAAVLLSAATFLRLLPISFRIGGLFFAHWLGIAGSSFIGVYTPFYYVAKRRYPKKLKALFNLHVFGNLLAFMLVSIHIAQQLGRPLQFYPDLGAGLALYIIMLLLVATGYIHRFGLLGRSGKLQLPHRNRYAHVSLTLSFYIVVIVHSLKGFGLI